MKNYSSSFAPRSSKRYDVTVKGAVSGRSITINNAFIVNKIRIGNVICEQGHLQIEANRHFIFQGYLPNETVILEIKDFIFPKNSTKLYLSHFPLLRDKQVLLHQGNNGIRIAVYNEKLEFERNITFIDLGNSRILSFIYSADYKK